MSSAEWYQAKSPTDRQGAYAWCFKHFGPDAADPDDSAHRWYYTIFGNFRFRDAKDYEWFLLRWGV